MDCASCGRNNRPGARFCGGCGGSLAPRCPACNAPSAPDARFCDACGAALDAAPRVEKGIARKVVTVVFADLIGSVSLQERLDAESARRAMDHYHRAMTAALEIHGGRVVQLLGDGVLAAFGVPRVAEDDALRAVRAAVGMQRAFRELAREQGGALAGVGLRVAVNTGEVVVSDDETAVIGDPTNVAARLQQEARDGDVLVGEGTARLVAEVVTLAPLGSLALRGRAGTVTAYRVVSLERPVRAQAVSFVGRDEELRRLLGLFDAAAAEPGARLGVLVGSPGLGKSRLLAELVRRIGERASVLSARCDAAGGATFAPIAEALRAFLGIEEGAGGDGLRAAIDAVVSGDDAERTRIATGIAALLAGAPAAPQETFFVVRRFLAALACVRPVVLVIDDLHWAEPLLLDLVEHLKQWSTGVPLLVLVAARPELRDARSALATAGGAVSDVVTLSGLDAVAAMRLAANVIGASELPAALLGRVLATSEGNPLFVSELVRMLVQDGTLRREDERWVTTVDLAKLDMPPTIQVLLAARIERLRPEERVVLERAAVIGRQFSRAAVALLLPREAADLDARLEALRRSELIESDTGWFLGEPALRFHHALIRDAAYRRVLKETRAELHETFADWVTARAGDSTEHDETIGFHLEHAHQNRLELGALDAHGRTLGERAAQRLGAAGRRALARDDVALAAGLLGRALARLDPEDSARADLALDWCEALLAAGEVSSAPYAVAELERFAASSERLRAWHVCFAGQLAALTDPQSLRATGEAVAAAAASLADCGDAAGEAKAHSVHAIALSRLGAIGACEAALDKALAAARRARDRRRANAVLAGAPLAALWGPSPVTRASGRCLDVVRVLRITQGAPGVEAVALRCQAVLEALRGRGEAGRRMIESSRRMVEELGIAQQVLEADVFAGLIELLEGDAAAAEPCLRRAYEGMRARGLGIDAARAAALLGRALLAQGRAGEAEALSHASEALAGDDLKAAIAWRGVRAEALATRGEAGAAVELARAAVEIAAGTDALLDHADARTALAVALRAAGCSVEADAEERRAAELWSSKGATVLVARAPGEMGREAPQETRATAQQMRARVGPNAATASAAALVAAFAARDLDGIAAEFAADIEIVDHPTGLVYGRQGALDSWEALLRAGGAFAIEPIATLGDSLALCRQSATAGGIGGARVDVGPYQQDYLVLIEMNADAQTRRAEQFAVDRLGDAMVRLYERHAELLPEGGPKTRAVATARAVAALQRLDVLGLGERVSADVEFVDHRRMGFASARGDDWFRRSNGITSELVDDPAQRVDEILALGPDGYLVRATASGRQRDGGGVFEIEKLDLRRFGADGRLARTEWWNVGSEAEALARFEVLGDEHPKSPRVRSFEQAVVATLGDSLALCRSSDPSTAWPDGDLASSGPVRGGSEIALVEVGPDGHQRRLDRFAGDRLAEAIVRLYERYAERQPDGPERTTAFGVAASLAVVFGPQDADVWRPAIAPDIETRDWRTVGYGLVRGREPALANFDTLLSLSGRVETRIDDVLRAEPRALALAWSDAGELPDGGGFEREMRVVILFGAAGTVLHWEQFDAAQEEQALARFDALVAHTEASSVRRVRPNAATRNDALLEAAVNARDEAALADLFADFAEAVHHPTGISYDRAATLASFGSTLHAASHLSFHHEPVATLGDSLAIVRGLVTFSGFAHEDLDVGPVEREQIVLVESTTPERRQRSEIFARDRLGDAIARLYARWAETRPVGPERTRAATVARAVAAVVATDAEAIAPVLAPELEFVDHRPLGFGRSRGAARYLRGLRTLEEVTQERLVSEDDVLAATADALLLQRRSKGVDREGGAFELHLLLLWTFGADGCIEHIEMFDAERATEALARFELFAGGASESLFANAATRAHARALAAWRDGDWERFAAQFPAEMHYVDRRPFNRLEGDRDSMLAGLRPVFHAVPDLHAARTQFRILATRGERLALVWTVFAFRVDQSAPGEVECLHVLEGDDACIRIAVLFELTDLDAAYAELDRRYAAGEGARFAALAPLLEQVEQAMGALDPEALERLRPDDFTSILQRRFAASSLDATRSKRGTIQSMAVARGLGARGRVRCDHLRVSERAWLAQSVWLGTREGGAFEMGFVIAARHDGRRTSHWEVYGDDQVQEALARFEELSREPRRPARIENAATRSEAALERCWEAHDWDGLVALLSPVCRTIDRRPLMHLETDLAATLEGWRPFLGRSLRTHEILATRGERLALNLSLVRGSDDLVGPAEVSWLQVTETDAAGLRVATVAFAPDDLDAAYAELDARYLAGEGAAFADKPAAVALLGYPALLAARDWDRVRALFAPGFVARDHRPLGAETLHGGDEQVARLRALLELGPDTHFRLDHVLAGDGRRALAVMHAEGSEREGAFEIPVVIVQRFDASGRALAFDVFDLDQLDAACACYARDAATTGGPALTNAATRSQERFREAWTNRDFDALSALFRADFRVDEQRRTVQAELGRDELLRSFRFLFERAEALYASGETLATRGERLTLTRLCVGGSERGTGPSEVELLQVLEVDEAGANLRAATFDPDDVDAAYARLDAWYAEGGAAASPRAALASPAGGDALAWRLRPNAAVRATKRFDRLARSGDWAGLAALLADSFRYEDRRRLVRDAGDRTKMVASVRHAMTVGGRIQPWSDATQVSSELLATAGDRLALQRFRFRAGEHERPLWEVESLQIVEVDGEGRLVAHIAFDPDHRRAAAIELFERFARSEEGRPARCEAAFLRAVHARDRAAMSAALPDDFVFRDERRIGIGSDGGADDYVAWVAAALEHSEELTLESLHFEAVAAYGSWGLGRSFGTLRDGGAFENVVLRVCHYDGERYAGVELFEPTEWERAKTRFEELGRAYAARRAEPLRIPPNAAARTSARLRELSLIGDLTAVRALCAPNAHFEDRRRLLRTEGDREMLVANVRHVGRAVWERETRTLLATCGERLALHQNRFVGAPGGVRFEVETLELVEIEGEGRIAAQILFDADDRRAAAVEMLERYIRGEGARVIPESHKAFLRAMPAHDLAGMRAALEAGFTVVDHRRTGLGSVGDADTYIASVAAMLEQSDDFATEVLYHVAVAEHGSLSVGRTFGTLRGGGPFESVYVRLNRYEDGRSVGAELFEIEQLDRARARFDELGHAHRERERDPLAIPPNAATRALERFDALARAGAWDAFAELLAAGFRYEDRRPHMQDAGDRSQMIASVRVAMAGGACASMELLATAGDRLALHRILFTGREAERGLWEIEVLQITEVDADGRILAQIVFEATDRRGAAIESFERFFSSEAGRSLPPEEAAVVRAIQVHDLEALRAALPADFAFRDHRATGIGPDGGRDDYVAWMAAAMERSEDLAVEALRYFEIAPHGSLSLGRAFGTLRDGGAFESVTLRLCEYRDGRYAGVEFFEPTQWERAKARVEELGRGLGPRRATAAPSRA